MNANEDPFGYVGPAKNPVPSGGVEPTVIIASPGQEYRIVVVDRPGRQSSHYAASPDEEGYTSSSPGPDDGVEEGYTSSSPGPDRCFPDQS